jgi:gliding motility-associated lipoprotein GldD
MKHSLFLVLFTLLCSCSEDPVARPNGLMRIGLPAQLEYGDLPFEAPFDVKINAEAKAIEKEVLSDANTQEFWMDLAYPSILSTVQFTYKPVTENLEELVRDAQQLAYKHTVKASGMREQFFAYPEERVYGLYYEFSGASATTTQFYATDSSRHFVRGVLYHYSTPNADSLAPVTQFMREEILKMIGTLQWNESEESRD